MYYDPESLMNVERRRGVIFTSFNFICSCELCQDEEINDDNASYERFKILEEEAEKMEEKQYTVNFQQLKFGGCGSSNCFEEKYELLLKWIACYKQMYNLVIFISITYLLKTFYDFFHENIFRLEAKKLPRDSFLILYYFTVLEVVSWESVPIQTRVNWIIYKKN